MTMLGLLTNWIPSLWVTAVKTESATTPTPPVTEVANLSSTTQYPVENQNKGTTAQPTEKAPVKPILSAIEFLDSGYHNAIPIHVKTHGLGTVAIFGDTFQGFITRAHDKRRRIIQDWHHTSETTWMLPQDPTLSSPSSPLTSQSLEERPKLLVTHWQLQGQNETARQHLFQATLKHLIRQSQRHGLGGEVVLTGLNPELYQLAIAAGFELPDDLKPKADEVKQALQTEQRHAGIHPNDVLLVFTAQKAQAMVGPPHLTPIYSSQPALNITKNRFKLPRPNPGQHETSFTIGQHGDLKLVTAQDGLGSDILGQITTYADGRRTISTTPTEHTKQIKRNNNRIPQAGEREPYGLSIGDELRLGHQVYVVNAEGLMQVSNNPTTPKAFPAGLNKLHFRQGTVGNCYFLASLYALSRNPHGKAYIYQMIESIDEKKSAHVRFPGFPEQPVNIERRLYGGAKDNWGVQVLEHAFAKLQHTLGYRKHTGTDLKQITDGGEMYEALVMMTGIKPFAVGETRGRQVKPLAQQCLTTPQLKKRAEALFKIAAQKPQSFVLTASTIPHLKTTPDIPGRWHENHAYALTNIDSQKQTITLVNPHNTTQPQTLTWTQFYHLFDQIQGIQLPH